MVEKVIILPSVKPSTPKTARGRQQNRWRYVSGLIAALVCALVWGLPASSQGAGFALVQQGAAAMAQGNAFVAEADDPSAIFYNPAGLIQLKRPEIYWGKFFQYPDREYHAPGGTVSETQPRFYWSSSLFMTYPVNDRVALGVGVFAPFGLGSVWPASWEGRYITTFSRLKTYNVNPVISLKLSDKLSIGGGVNILWSEVRIKRRVPVVIPPGVVLPDGEAALEGHGTGFGANLGILYEPIEGIKLGASYRSQVYVRHTGNLKTSLPIRIPGLRYSIDGSAKLIFPPSVNFGISISRLPRFTFNLDATWTGWSTYDELKINLSQPLLVNKQLVSSLVTEKNWRDAWAIRFGMNFQVKDHTKLRVGYTYDMTPVPDSTFEPQVPDANRHIFAVGSELKIWRLTLGIAYNYILFEPRTKNNLIATNGVPLPVAFQANGKYRSDNHSLGLSTSFRF